MAIPILAFWRGTQLLCCCQGCYEGLAGGSGGVDGCRLQPGPKETVMARAIGAVA